MELASMLAGEPFSDRPRCADPVIAAYLRAFNDRLDARERDRLRPYASAVVGTSGSRRATAARRRRCLRFAGGREHAGPLTRLRLAALVGLRPAVRVRSGAPEWAAREVIARGDVEAGFQLLDDLLPHPPSEPPALALPVAPAAQQRVPALTA